MTDIVDAFLSHHGVKGMKWGVRRGADGARPIARRLESSKFGKAAQNNVNRHDARVSKRAEKKADKADAKWEKNIYSTQGAVAVHNHVADQMNSHLLNELNNHPDFKGKDLTKNPTLEKAYYSRYEKVADKAYAKAVNDVHGVSPSGRKAAMYINDHNGARIEVRSGVHVAHANVTEPDLVIPVKLKKTGHVHSAEPAPALQQSDVVGDFFAHHGVKGMKWGVRRSHEERSAPSKVIEKTKTARRGAQDIKVHNRAGRGVVRTAGGKRNIASNDAVVVRAHRQKAKASTTDALANHELKKVVDRMNLEKQFRDLKKQEPKVKRGRDAAADLLKQHGPALLKLAGAAAGAPGA